jgi:esterase/lipase
MDKKNEADNFIDIDEKIYDWSINIIRSVIKVLKVKVKLHADQQALNGDIILCNHFSRFETLIPQFLIYEETGAYCCAIASGEFFKDDSILTGYLNSVGVIPHDHQNLFSNLARQIFLGRKVIIFPEGGMVKDRRVLDHQGNYSIFSRISGERRKQHTGAAVLAQGVEVFKAAVRNAYSNKEYDKLMHWKEQLKLDSLDQLLTTALKPTLIVPSNITFYPIRSSENLLLKGVELFADGLTKRQTEELLVEGNIMLKDTDLDLHLGSPVDPYEIWHWWNRHVLKMVSSEFSSLDQIFSLYSSPKNLKQKLLGYYFRKNAKVTRNQYMAEIYANLTINLSHLASALIMYCMRCGLQQINKYCFYKTLYIAVKCLQNTKNINLHRSLLNPDEYNDLIEGKSKRFEHFIEMAELSGLIASYHDNYQFLPKLCEEFDFDSIRMENLIAVYDNEVEPIPIVLDTVIDAYKQCSKITGEQLAEWQFEDEILSLTWDKQRYSNSRYDDINNDEIADEDPQPFLLKPSHSNGIAVLLIHGLLASPAELRDYAETLFEQGYTVLAVRLKGHGTSPYDLRKQTHENWYESVKRGMNILSVYCDAVVVIGFSTGGFLALKLAAEKMDNVVAVVAAAVPIKFVDKLFLVVPLLHGTNRLLKWVSLNEGIKPFLENTPEHPLINYKNVPVKSLYELRRLSDEVEALLPDIKIPTLIVYADEDPVVDFESAKIIFEKLATKHKKLISIQSKRHGVLMENIGGLWESINRFLQTHIIT